MSSATQGHPAQPLYTQALLLLPIDPPIESSTPAECRQSPFAPVPPTDRPMTHTTSAWTQPPPLSHRLGVARRSRSARICLDAAYESCHRSWYGAGATGIIGSSTGCSGPPRPGRHVATSWPAPRQPLGTGSTWPLRQPTGSPVAAGPPTPECCEPRRTAPVPNEPRAARPSEHEPQSSFRRR